MIIASDARADQAALVGEDEPGSDASVDAGVNV